MSRWPRPLRLVQEPQQARQQGRQPEPVRALEPEPEPAQRLGARRAVAWPKPAAVRRADST